MEVWGAEAEFCALGGNGIMGFLNLGAEFCALGGNGILGSNGYSPSSLLACLSDELAIRDDG